MSLPISGSVSAGSPVEVDLTNDSMTEVNIQASGGNPLEVRFKTRSHPNFTLEGTITDIIGIFDVHKPTAVELTSLSGTVEYTIDGK